MSTVSNSVAFVHPSCCHWHMNIKNTIYIQNLNTALCKTLTKSVLGLWTISNQLTSKTYQEPTSTQDTISYKHQKTYVLTEDGKEQRPKHVKAIIKTLCTKLVVNIIHVTMLHSKCTILNLLLYQFCVLYNFMELNMKNMTPKIVPTLKVTLKQHCQFWRWNMSSWHQTRTWELPTNSKNCNQ